MRPRSSTNAVLVAALVALAPAGVRAQAIGQGFDLERTGRLDAAAAFYLSAARGDPTNLPALLGLERVLPQLDRMWELLPLVQRAVARDSASGALRGLLVRTYVALDLPDSVAAVAGRWARARPDDEQPYREWAQALFDKAGQPKELWLVEGAKHNQALALANGDYRRRVLEFFDRLSHRLLSHAQAA